MFFNPRAVREEAGLSQAAIAPLVGLHQSSVSKVELGTRELSLREAEAWLHVCGYQIEAHRFGSEVVLEESDRQLVDRVIAALPRLGAGERRTLEVLLAAWSEPQR
jgi:transcriptional regulator with XRE-family HTH domain